MSIRRLAIAVTVLASPGWGAAWAADRPPGLEGSTLYRAEVTGMSCPFCAYGVEQRLQTMDHVEYVDANVEAGWVLIGVGGGATLGAERVSKLVEEAGFRLEGMEQVPLEHEVLENRAAGE